MDCQKRNRFAAAFASMQPDMDLQQHFQKVARSFSKPLDLEVLDAMRTEGIWPDDDLCEL